MNDNWYTQWRIVLDHIAESRRYAMKRRLLAAVRSQNTAQRRNHGVSESA